MAQGTKDSASVTALCPLDQPLYPCRPQWLCCCGSFITSQFFLMLSDVFLVPSQGTCMNRLSLDLCLHISHLLSYLEQRQGWSPPGPCSLSSLTSYFHCLVHSPYFSYPAPMVTSRTPSSLASPWTSSPRRSLTSCSPLSPYFHHSTDSLKAPTVCSMMFQAATTQVWLVSPKLMKKSDFLVAGPECKASHF